MCPEAKKTWKTNFLSAIEVIFLFFLCLTFVLTCSDQSKKKALFTKVPQSCSIGTYRIIFAGFSSSLRLIMHFSPCQSSFIMWMFLLGALLVFTAFHLTFFSAFQQLAFSLYDYWLYHMPKILKIIIIGIPQQKYMIKSMGCGVR